MKNWDEFVFGPRLAMTSSLCESDMVWARDRENQQSRYVPFGINISIKVLVFKWMTIN